MVSLSSNSYGDGLYVSGSKVDRVNVAFLANKYAGLVSHGSKVSLVNPVKISTTEPQIEAKCNTGSKTTGFKNEPAFKRQKRTRGFWH